MELKSDLSITYLKSRKLYVSFYSPIYELFLKPPLLPIPNQSPQWLPFAHAVRDESSSYPTPTYAKLITSVVRLIVVLRASQWRLAWGWITPTRMLWTRLRFFLVFARLFRRLLLVPRRDPGVIRYFLNTAPFGAQRVFGSVRPNISIVR